MLSKKAYILFYIFVPTAISLPLFNFLIISAKIQRKNGNSKEFPLIWVNIRIKYGNYILLDPEHSKILSVMTVFFFA